MVPRGVAADAAHTALFGVQNLEPEPMVAGIALLFAAVCERCALSPQGAHELGRRLLRDQDFHTKTNGSLQSLRDFAGIRIMGEKDVVVA